MVYRYFLFNFNVIHELITSISVIMPNFRVRSQETSKTTLENVFLTDVVKMTSLMTSSFSVLNGKIFKIE